MAKTEEKIDEALLKDDDLSITLIPKTRTGYMREQKIKLMKEIGIAQAALLLQKTPAHEIKKRKGGGGMELSYVEHAYVSETLNFATLMNWDLIVLEREKIGDDEVVVHGYLEVRFLNGMIVKKYASGGAKKSYPNQPMADVYNSATSKMLRAAAARLGIGLDLYRHEASVEEEAEYKSTTPVTISADDNEPATDTQIETMKNLGVVLPDEPVTKGIARRAIADAVKKGKNGSK